MEQYTYIKGGLYTTYDGLVTIYCGQYPNSQNELKNLFIEINGCHDYSRNEIISYIHNLGINKMMQNYYMLDPLNGWNNFGYLGTLPNYIYSEVDKQVKEWSKKPWAT